MPSPTPQEPGQGGTVRLQGVLQESQDVSLPAAHGGSTPEAPFAHQGERWTIPSSRLRVPGMGRDVGALRRAATSPVRRSGRSLELLLTKKELGELLELDYALACLRDPAEFPELLARVAKLIPATSILAVASYFDPARQEARLATSAVHDYPEEWLRRYFCNGYVRLDPIVQRYAATFQMVAWSPVLREAQSRQASAFTREAKDFGMAYGLTCGIRDAKSCQATLFSVSGRELESEIRHRSVFQHLIPHLNGAIIRVSGIPANPARIDALSLRELEVMRWMKEGKSNWEVSRILRVSEATVKFHVKNILAKLQASNRSHAIALAMEHRAL
ncbi:autoinducer binding domain-containing protein [Methylacidimicrobium sp. B4]|uniref:autoinducer binding domain-containing protein n=1 Tax=Methylacidimicrobium sp. B4 TaxID=2796139 RepID=UPI001A8CAD0C|nr:autoinducer binding domain-containing protein [Methylacidimicrobium sp. B4]QSR85435.1 autoinducer binding domain-containing protein [Methylacidimicrobium sp. B4]